MESKDQKARQSKAKRNGEMILREMSIFWNESEVFKIAFITSQEALLLFLLLLFFKHSNDPSSTRGLGVNKRKLTITSSFLMILMTSIRWLLSKRLLKPLRQPDGQGFPVYGLSRIL